MHAGLPYDCMRTPMAPPYCKRVLRKLERALHSIGLQPRRLVWWLRRYPRYQAQCKAFQRLGGIITHRYPILTGDGGQAGTASGHYFHQDLLVATYVHDRNPDRHIDIGSRIDGFVAHLASFRNVEVMDVRDLKDTGHRNIAFIRADLMDAGSVQENITDSLSCLHAIEHFGLGRYGDPLDPDGHIKGFRNMVSMLKPGGMLYVSFPIGKADEVHFNAHRVFHPRAIFAWTEDIGALRLARFDYVDDNGNLHRDADPMHDGIDVVYGCGIYTFEKRSYDVCMKAVR